MKRLFWLTAGLSAGAATAVIASRFVKKQAEKMAPANVARAAGSSAMDVGKRFSSAMQEGKRAMDERETEVREKIHNPDAR